MEGWPPSDPISSNPRKGAEISDTTRTAPSAGDGQRQPQDDPRTYSWCAGLRSARAESMPVRLADGLGLQCSGTVDLQLKKLVDQARLRYRADLACPSMGVPAQT